MIAVREIVQSGLLQRGRDPDGHGMIGEAHAFGDRGDGGRMRGLFEVNDVGL
jgi:hypothetical protein